MTTWTEERVELLRTMWATHLSAMQIAKQLGGVSRNAVIGKARRLKLAWRQNPSLPSHGSNPPRPPRPPAPFGIHRSKTPRTPPQIAAAAPAKMPLAQPQARMLAIADLKNRDCRWPLGEATGYRQLFCACPTVDIDLSYCAYHLRLSVGAGTYSERRAI